MAKRKKALNKVKKLNADLSNIEKEWEAGRKVAKTMFCILDFKTQNGGKKWEEQEKL